MINSLHVFFGFVFPEAIFIQTSSSNDVFCSTWNCKISILPPALEAFHSLLVSFHWSFENAVILDGQNTFIFFSIWLITGKKAYIKTSSNIITTTEGRMSEWIRHNLGRKCLARVIPRCGKMESKSFVRNTYGKSKNLWPVNEVRDSESSRQHSCQWWHYYATDSASPPPFLIRTTACLTPGSTSCMLDFWSQVPNSFTCILNKIPPLPRLLSRMKIHQLLKTPAQNSIHVPHSVLHPCTPHSLPATLHQGQCHQI